MKKIISCLFILFSCHSYATLTLENNFNIKAGLSLNRIYFNSNLIPNGVKKDDSTESFGVGFNTSVGYKWNTFELMVGSDIVFGNLKDLAFKIDSAEVQGSGHFRIFTVSPILRFYTPYILKKHWNLYIGAGPTWSLHTFILSSNINGSNFSSKQRISFENRGGSLNIGFEEIVPFKYMHPTFIEIGYSYMRSHKISVVDATDFKDVKTQKQGASEDFHGHYFIIRTGITLF